MTGMLHQKPCDKLEDTLCRVMRMHSQFCSSTAMSKRAAFTCIDVASEEQGQV